jgi:hypothetical protein
MIKYFNWCLESNFGKINDEKVVGEDANNGQKNDFDVKNDPQMLLARTPTTAKTLKTGEKVVGEDAKNGQKCSKTSVPLCLRGKKNVKNRRKSCWRGR